MGKGELPHPTACSCCCRRRWDDVIRCDSLDVPLQSRIRCNGIFPKNRKAQGEESLKTVSSNRTNQHHHQVTKQTCWVSLLFNYANKTGNFAWSTIKVRTSTQSSQWCIVNMWTISFQFNLVLPLLKSELKQYQFDHKWTDHIDVPVHLSSWCAPFCSNFLQVSNDLIERDNNNCNDNKKAEHQGQREIHQNRH